MSLRKRRENKRKWHMGERETCIERGTCYQLETNSTDILKKLKKLNNK